VQLLADLIGVHRNTVMRWEAGTVQIPQPSVLALRWLFAGAPNVEEAKRLARRPPTKRKVRKAITTGAAA
jgi:hypothetical protein